MKLKKWILPILGLGLVLLAVVIAGPRSSENLFGELVELADKYDTDKGTRIHRYAEVYEYFLRPIKQETRRILEIGVARGASLQMWRDYFPNADIFGIDIDDKSHLDSGRIKTFIADQSDREKLKEFTEMHGGDFDIIVDDGGHYMDQQQISFGYLFRYLKPKGYYIIEDVHTSLTRIYGPDFGARPDEENTTLRMVNRYIRDGVLESEYMTEEEKEYIWSRIEYCNIMTRNRGRTISVVFKKK